ncbi:uncharacterized protein ACN63O_004199 [Diretmus argenteus]
MGDHLSDCSPLISAAASGKLRLVRLLLEGGAQVNGRNTGGETPLLAACKVLRGEPTRPETVKLLTYLLQNKADPNAQDRAGRTPLMYACMQQAGAQVASTLLAAGADPSMEDNSGASALVYAINAQHQLTLQVLMDACRAKGRDIIIIATDMGVSGAPVTRRYLNVLPSPDTSPVSCMSPSDIVLKTGSPRSSEGENIFNFRTPGKRGSSSSDVSQLTRPGTPRPRQRVSSEPRLTIQNVARLNRAYEEGVRERSLQESGAGQDVRRERIGEEDEEREDEEIHFLHTRVDGSVVKGKEGLMKYGGENFNGCHASFPRVSQSLLNLTELHSPRGRLAPERATTPRGATSDRKTQNNSADKLPICLSPRWQARRNTLPSLTAVPPLLHLPPLVNQSDSYLQVPPQVSPCKGASVVFQPHPPGSYPSSSSFRARPVVLPPLPLTSSLTSLVAPPAGLCSEKGRRSPRHHSVQLAQIRGEVEEITLLDL